jgi:chromosome segregation ATPase
MKRTCSLAGKQELSDKTRYESIKILNQTLMERLGEVTGELNNTKAELKCCQSGRNRAAAHIAAENELARTKAELAATMEEADRLRKALASAKEDFELANDELSLESQENESLRKQLDAMNESVVRTMEAEDRVQMRANDLEEDLEDIHGQKIADIMKKKDEELEDMEEKSRLNVKLLKRRIENIIKILVYGHKNVDDDILSQGSGRKSPYEAWSEHFTETRTFEEMGIDLLELHRAAFNALMELRGR